jgi:WD40 repeat protein
VRRLFAFVALLALALPLDADDAPAPIPLGSVHMKDRGRVVALAFSGDGKLLLTGDDDGSFVVRDGATRKILSGYSPVGSDALGFPTFAFAPDGSKVYVAGYNATEVRVHDSATGKVLERIGPLPEVRGLAVSPDGKTVAIRMEDAIQLKGASEKKLDLKGTLGVAFSPDGLLVASGKDAIVFVDPATLEQKKKLTWRKKRDGSGDGDDDEPRLGAHAPSFFAFSGKNMATAGGRSIRIWDLEQGQLDFEFPEAEDFVARIAFSSDGKRIASGSDDGNVYVWSIAKQKQIGKLEGHGGSVTCVAYTPDGSTLVSGSKDMTVRAWNAKDGDELEKWVGHTEPIVSVAFSPDGKEVVTAGRDERVIVWEAATGKFVRENPGHRALFSPNGKVLACEVSNGLALYKGDELERTIETEATRIVGFTKDSKQIVGVQSGKRPTVVVWETTDGEEACNHKLEKNASAESVVIDAASGVVWWVNGIGAVRSLELENLTEGKLPGDLQAKEIAFSPRGELALLDLDSNLHVLDPKTGEEKKALGPAEGPLLWTKAGLLAGPQLDGKALPVKPHAASLSPDGQLVAIADEHGGAWIYRLK